MSSELPAAVQAKYGAAARRVLDGEGVPADCCSTIGCCEGAAASSCDPITSEFLKGEIEAIPLPGSSVDIVISNCVINLSSDKRKVLAEAHRVLKPGGRFAVSDVVVQGELPDEVRRNMELWIGCVAGALRDEEFIDLLRETGFERPSIEMTRFYSYADARGFLANAGLDADRIAATVAGRLGAAFVRARKPAA